MKVQITPSAAAAAKKAGDRLRQLLLQYRDQPVLLLLSGGSALAMLDYLQPQDLSPGITIQCLDERHSEDPAINNFAQLMATSFFSVAKQASVTFVDTRIQPGKSLEELAQRMETSLRNWHQQNPSGVTLATMGIGPDGHTSGIMTFPEDPRFFKQLFQGKRWVVGYSALAKSPYLRATTTLTYLKRLHHVVAYAVGEEKRDVLSRLQQPSKGFAAFPAMILHELPDVVLYTDQPQST